MVKVLEDLDEYSEAIKNSGLVVVDFFATWCGPCKMVAPKFEEFSKKYASVKFFKVDVDENEDAAAEAEISAMPTFLLFKDGEQVDTLLGPDAAKLEVLILKHL